MMFKSIGIIAKQNIPNVIETLITLIDYLQKKGLKIFLESKAATLIGSRCSLPDVGDCHALCEKCDLAIIVGGDGSLLGAARQLGEKHIPLVGINRGKLGFLTDIKPEEIQAELDAILEGHYREEDRFMLEACISDGSSVCNTALNEVVLGLGQTARMLDFEIYIDNQFMYSQRSDGLIIATPTGSTAYSLSAGGPILHPSLNAIVMIPMFPHTLSNRPIVINADSHIMIRIPEKTSETPRITCDSQCSVDINFGEEVHIRKSKNVIRLIHPLTYDYFEVLRSKLHWGRKIETSGGH